MAEFICGSSPASQTATYMHTNPSITVPQHHVSARFGGYKSVMYFVAKN